MALVAGRLEVWKASLWASTDISDTRFFLDLSLSIHIDNRTHLRSTSSVPSVRSHAYGFSRETEDLLGGIAFSAPTQ